MHIQQIFQTCSWKFSMNKNLGGKLLFLIFSFMVALTSSVQAAPLTVTVVDTLDFGLFTPGTNGGTVSFPANGNVSATGDVILLGSEQKGQVTIQANDGDSVTVTVSTDKVGHVSTSAEMNFIGNCIGPGGSLGTDQCTFTATGGVDTVSVGAVLTVGTNATQNGGHYSGTTAVTAQGP